MLNQSEINFYIGNKDNILHKAHNKRITSILKYDSNYKNYVITRKTPKTTIIERTKDYQKAYKLYLAFLYLSFKELEYRLINYGSYIGGLY